LSHRKTAHILCVALWVPRWIQLSTYLTPRRRKSIHDPDGLIFRRLGKFNLILLLYLERLGLGLQAFVRVQLARHDAEAVAAFAGVMNDWDEVVACHALTDDMDYLLQVVVRDLEHFSHFLLDRLLNQAGVADMNSSFVLRRVNAFRGLPLGR
jgi:DNA-binding Lrp family transcriptional regulator